MTGRERILKTLARETPDRVPWAPLIEYNFLNAQPDDIRELGVVGFCKKYNIDIIAKNTVGAYEVHSPNVSVKTFINGKEIKVPEEKDNWQAEVYGVFSLHKYRDPDIKIIEKNFETPIGILKTSYKNLPSSRTVFQDEFFIKKIEDLKILKFMYEDIIYIPKYDDIKKEDDFIGKDGIVAAGVPGSAVIELMEEYIGIENFHYFLNDYKTRIEEIMDCILAKNLEAYDIAAKSTSPLLVVWEDAGTGLYSPRIFRKYIQPALKKYTEIAHYNDKVILLHACGLINSLIEDIIHTGIDGITDMSPYPTGNVDFPDIRKKSGKDLILTGGIDPTVITSKDENILRERVEKLLDDMKPYGNFILGSADAMPANTPVENLEIIYEIIEERGYY